MYRRNRLKRPFESTKKSRKKHAKATSVKSNDEKKTTSASPTGNANDTKKNANVASDSKKSKVSPTKAKVSKSKTVKSKNKLPVKKEVAPTPVPKDAGKQ